jgi:hypothetical protein
MNFNKKEEQFQLSNELYKEVISFIKLNNMTFGEFCKNLNLPEYMTGKILDRKIKMHIYLDYIKKIANYVQAKDIPICEKKF